MRKTLRAAGVLRHGGRITEVLARGCHGRRRGSDVRERYGERRAGAELIEFDPESWDSNVDRWLSKIYQLGRIYYSADYKKTHFMQLKLVGPAKVWFHRCVSGAALQGDVHHPGSSPWSCWRMHECSNAVWPMSCTQGSWLTWITTRRQVGEVMI